MKRGRTGFVNSMLFQKELIYLRSVLFLKHLIFFNPAIVTGFLAAAMAFP